MHYSLLANPRWLIGLSFEIFVASWAIRRGYFRQLPVFTAYLTVLVVGQLFYWVVLVSKGLTSRASFWSYWATQAIFLVFRAGTVVELARRILSPFLGIWALARILLITIGGILLLIAGVATYQKDSLIAFIPTLERGIEFAIVGMLGFVILFARYYEIMIERPVMLIAIGLLFYSAIGVANSHILATWLRSYFSIWDEIRQESFLVALITWLVAVWKPLAARAKPGLLQPAVYGEMMPAMNFQLRQLNGRLSEMLR